MLAKLKLLRLFVTKTINLFIAKTNKDFINNKNIFFDPTGHENSPKFVFFKFEQ